jgi:hypothetical protein
MTYESKINGLIEKYLKGMYAPGELFLLLARETPEDRIARLFELTPHDILSEFKKWVNNYPFENGAMVSGSNIDKKDIEIVYNNVRSIYYKIN